LVPTALHEQPAWPASALDWNLKSLTQTLGLEAQAVGCVDSTNTELMRRVRAGRLTQPVLLAAERQSAARGRLGRAWQTGLADAPGSALAFSLALPLQPRDWSGLSLAVGLAVAESLHPAIRIKWPNDLWLWDGRQGRKLAGILIETAAPPKGGQGADAVSAPVPEQRGEAGAARIAVIGVGINIAPLAGQDFSMPPAALRELRPDLDAPGALAAIAPSLLAAVRAFAREGFAPLVERYAARDLLAGQQVRCSDGVEGLALGVGAGGALCLRLADGTRRQVISAEVSVRPVPLACP
jgi:BirA family biotin operon repressor/biotin-[acetyl-CoA-carboxylase] ligase